MADLRKPIAEDLRQWLSMGDVKEFLARTARGSRIPVHYQNREELNSVYLASVLLPRRLLKGADMDELVDWNIRPSAGGWGYGYRMLQGGRKKYTLFRPFDGQRPAILEKAVPIYTFRTNPCEGEGREDYAEINPQITHVHELHWVEERSAYCKLDDAGDVCEVITVKLGEGEWSVTIPEGVLFKHLLLGDYVLARFFDFDRSVSDHIVVPDADDYEAREKWSDVDIEARWTPVRGKSGETVRAFLRGFQIIRPPSNARERLELLEGKRRKNFCTFIALDWKHGKVAEVSCDPDTLGNYFVESPHPFSTSPAFFKREVLRRYQDDPDKYTIESKLIYCRSAWSLNFGVNDAGQVHAYLKDLAHLPYSEQLYWKSFNESPKGPISEGDYRRDFLGEWHSDPDPLEDLKQLLKDFPRANTPIGPIEVWEAPKGLDSNLAARVHYLATTSSKEWETEIVALDRLAVEGLNLKYLRRVAEEVGVGHEKLGSIVLLRDLLATKGVASDLVSSIFDPLKELHDLRSKFGSHRKGSETEKIAKEIRRQNKDLAAHHRRLVNEVSEAMRIFAGLVLKGHLDTSR